MRASTILHKNKTKQTSYSILHQRDLNTLTIKHSKKEKESSMRMQKRQFRIGELACKLSVEKFVIRFWEKEFGIKTTRSTGGQRFYQQRDYEKFQLIKELLYRKKYTIAGAKLYFQQMKKPKNDMVIASHKTTMEYDPHEVMQLKNQLLHIKKQLQKLRQLL